LVGAQARARCRRSRISCGVWDRRSGKRLAGSLATRTWVSGPRPRDRRLPGRSHSSEQRLRPRPHTLCRRTRCSTADWSAGACSSCSGRRNEHSFEPERRSSGRPLCCAAPSIQVLRLPLLDQPRAACPRPLEEHAARVSGADRGRPLPGTAALGRLGRDYDGQRKRAGPVRAHVPRPNPQPPRRGPRHSGGCVKRRPLAHSRHLSRDPCTGRNARGGRHVGGRRFGRLPGRGESDAPSLTCGMPVCPEKEAERPNPAPAPLDGRRSSYRLGGRRSKRHTAGPPGRLGGEPGQCQQDQRQDEQHEVEAPPHQ